MKYPCRSLAMLLALLAGCTVAPVDDAPPPVIARPRAMPAGWQAAVPAAMSVSVPASALPQAAAAPWSALGDELLPVLVAQAQQVSADLSQAAARVAAARASRTAAEAPWLPRLDLTADASRGLTDLADPLGTRAGLGLQASWELDLFGGAQSAAAAGASRLAGAQAARAAVALAVAAETAQTYTTLRACEARERLLAGELALHRATRQTLQRAAQAGLQTRQQLLAADAAGDQSEARWQAEANRCDSVVKALVALCGRDESALRQDLAAGQGRLPQPGPIGALPLPAELLQRRPDLAEAALAVSAAAADIGSSEARLWPRVTLTGSLGGAVLLRADDAGGRRSGSTWAVGPLQVTVPVFDAGVRRADREAARAAYDAAVARYDERVRRAVREVEHALVELRGSEAGLALQQRLVSGQDEVLDQTGQRLSLGLANRFELQDAQRGALSARLARMDQQARHAQAWIALVRALGGWPAPVVAAAARTAA